MTTIMYGVGDFPDMLKLPEYKMTVTAAPTETELALARAVNDLLDECKRLRARIEELEEKLYRKGGS